MKITEEVFLVKLRSLSVSGYHLAMNYSIRKSEKRYQRKYYWILSVSVIKIYGRFFQNLWENFYGYISMFLHVQTRNYGEGWPPLPLFINRKKCPDFRKKRHSDCVRLWIKFSIQYVVLRVTTRKNSKIFPCRTFSPVFNEMFIEVP